MSAVTQKGALRNPGRYEKMTVKVDANFRAEFVQNMCARYYTIDTIRSLFLVFSL